MNVSVLGCGRWGSFLGWYLSGRGFDVTVWGRKGGKGINKLLSTRANEYVTLPKSITLTDDLGFAVDTADVVIVSISAQELRGFMKELSPLLKDKKLVLCMKGLEKETGKRLSEIAVECGAKENSTAVWVGPGHIQEFVRGVPNCMVIDSYSPSLTRYLADLFKSNLIRFYYGNDIIGAEVGAAAKNVMGIVAGILDGLDKCALKGALMARGCREVSRLIAAMGGNEMTAYGLSHLGDYETTLFSPYSHNRGWGEAYAKGETFTRLAEGVPTAGALALLAEKYCVEMPITFAVNSAINDRIPPTDLIYGLFDRETKREFV